MRLSKHIAEETVDEGIITDVSTMWRKFMRSPQGRKSGYIEEDMYVSEIGMGTIRFIFPQKNMNEKWFIKTFLKGKKASDLTIGYNFVQLKEK